MNKGPHKKLEAAVARAVVKAQVVVTAVMLREYKESTRGARAAKREELDAWWSGEQRRRAVRARAMRGLRASGKARGREQKRGLQDAIADAVVGARKWRRRREADARRRQWGGR